MLLYGASGHGKVVADCLAANNIDIEGVFDDNALKSEYGNIKLLGNYSPGIFKESSLIISIGDNRTRKKISNIVKHNFGNACHPSAIISSSVRLDEGTVVFHGSVIQSSSVIGKHVIINTSASVDHDCIINDFVHISPKAALCGSVIVGEGTHIGAGAVVIQGINIGKWATIGAGTVIIRDVPDYAVVVGNPGKIIKYNSEMAAENHLGT